MLTHLLPLVLLGRHDHAEQQFHGVAGLVQAGHTGQRVLRFLDVLVLIIVTIIITICIHILIRSRLIAGSSSLRICGCSSTGSWATRGRASALASSLVSLNGLLDLGVVEPQARLGALDQLLKLLQGLHFGLCDVALCLALSRGRRNDNLADACRRGGL